MEANRFRFRAWDGEGEKMITQREWPNDMFIWADGTLWGFESDDSPKEGSLLRDHILMQSTGLTDANGVEVFEGDIITLPDHNLKQTVEWCDDTAGFRTKWDVGHSEHLYGIEMCIVIGNIYQDSHLLDNPELLNDSL